MPVNGRPRVREVEDELRAGPRTWLVTGAAGFIGSNLVERLLGLGQRVVGLDNFATGKRANLEDLAPAEGASRFRFVEGDICDRDACDDALRGVDVVLHQAALGSVPRSIADPLATHRANVDGFLTLLVAARDAGVGRFVYAASSSTYGDHPGLPKVEDQIGRALSPYAVSKHAGELYAGVFHRVYGMDTVGLRYFNVFGPRQDPAGPYAAVIPRWIGNLFEGVPCRIHGDGETSRDFCFVENVLQANLLAGTAPPAGVSGEVFNVACGQQATLNQVYAAIRGLVARPHPAAADAAPEYSDFRPGDVRHSLADIGKARRTLGYEPSHTVERGLAEAVAWYAGALEASGAAGEAGPARAGDQAGRISQPFDP
jgi:UDP-N-acetylglucosamine 4-epimerase